MLSITFTILILSKWKRRKKRPRTIKLRKNCIQTDSRLIRFYFYFFFLLKLESRKISQCIWNKLMVPNCFSYLLTFWHCQYGRDFDSLIVQKKNESDKFECFLFLNCSNIFLLQCNKFEEASVLKQTSIILNLVFPSCRKSFYH